MNYIDLPAPQPRQREFMQATERFVLFGGARGGGKSHALRSKAVVLAFAHPGIRILMLRATYDDVRDNQIEPLKKMLGNAVKYNELSKTMKFPNGSVIIFGYLSEKAGTRYQGRQYDIIMVDELTQFPEAVFDVLKGCLRGANTFPHRFLATANPGGIGHAWVKRLWIDRDFKQDEDPNDFCFIKSLVYDNKILMELDPQYEKDLRSLNSTLRKAWLEGDWDIFIGQYFSFWRRDIHVMRPFELDPAWPRYITMDYGRDMFACYFIAVDWNGYAYAYKEIYQSDLLASDAAELLRTYIEPDENIQGIFAPPDLWNKNNHSGRSTAEIFLEHDVVLEKTSNDRIQGWMDMSEWLKPIEVGGETVAGLRVFENCTNLIRVLPQVQFDERRPNDIAKEPHELTHACDAIRYFCAGRPRAGMPPIQKPRALFPELEYKETTGYGEVTIV